MSTLEGAGRQSEAEQVDSWRAVQFRRLGFDEHHVELLVERGIDYRYVEALLDQGCRPMVALLIAL